MKKMDLERSKRLARIARVFCRIAIWSSAVGLGLLLVALLIISVVPADHVKPLTDSGKLSVIVGSQLVPADAFTSAVGLRLYLLSIAGGVSAGVALFIVAAVRLLRILTTVEQGRPFAEENVRHMRGIGIALLVGSVVKPILEQGSLALANNISFRELNSVTSFDVTLLLCGLLVLVLSGVFNYGAYLQREHDQTV